MATSRKETIEMLRKNFSPVTKHSQNIPTPLGKCKQFISSAKLRFAKANPDYFINDNKPASYDDQKNDIVDACDRLLRVYRKNSKGEEYLWVQHSEKQRQNYFGRLYPVSYSEKNKKTVNTSVAEIPRLLRHWITQPNYLDFDIKNCHPVLIYNIGLMLGYEMKGIEQYIFDRESEMNEIMYHYGVGKDCAKQFFIQICYNGGYRGRQWFKDNGITDDGFEPNCCQGGCFKKKGGTNFYRDVQAIKDVFINEVFQDECEDIDTRHDEDEHDDKGNARKRSLFSYFIQQVEKTILLYVVDMCQKKYQLDTKSCIYAHDGFLIPYDQNLKRIYINPEKKQKFLETINKAVHKEFGIDLSFDFKTMSYDEELDDKLSDFTDTETQDPLDDADYYTCFDEIECTRAVIDYWTGFMHKSNGCFFVKVDGLWRENTNKEVKQRIRKMISQVPLKLKQKSDDDGKAINRFRYGVDNIYTTLMDQLDDDGGEFHRDFWSSNLGYLLFQDSIYCFADGQSYDFHDPAVSHVKSPFKIPDTFETPSQETVDFVEQVFFDDIFGDTEVKEHVKKLLARGLAGHVEDKDWISFRGERDSGKTKFFEFIQNAFGPYCGIGDWANFAQSKNNVGGDSARCRAWMKSFEYARLCFVSEAPPRGSALDGETIKKFTGGDPLEVRLPYLEAQKIRSQSRLIGGANDLPSIEPADAYQSCNHIEIPNVFVDEPRKDRHYERPKRDLEGVINNKEYLDALRWIILKSYPMKAPQKPESIKDHSKECMGDEADFETLFYQHFKVVDEPSHQVKTSDITAVMQQYFKTWTKKRINQNVMQKIGLERTSNRTHFKKVRERDEDDDDE